MNPANVENISNMYYLSLAMNSNSQSPNSTHPALLLLSRHPQTPATLAQIHAHLITTGLALHSFPLSRLLSSPALPIPTSLSILRGFPRPSTFLFNTLISSLASRRLIAPALRLYSHLLLPHSPKPNPHTFPSLLTACSNNFHGYGRALHAHSIKYHAIDAFVNAALITFYSSFTKLNVCLNIFENISSPDLATWNSIISAHAGTTEALTLFRQLQASTIRPNEITIVALVSTCGEIGTLGYGAWAHGYIYRRGLAMNRIVETAVVDMYSKCGRLDLAEQVFDAMPYRDTLCYNTMIRAFAAHGCARRAIALFDRMRCNTVGADDVTIVMVMTACAHAGMVEEGLWCFESVTEPKVEHYGCLVDLLGRAGRLEEAEGVVRAMPIEPNAMIYRALLGACTSYGNVEMGERVIERLSELEPEEGGQYVLLSNLYAGVDRWDEVRRMRKEMKDRGIEKSPGSSLIELDGVIHEFVMGDREHPSWREIYEMVDDIDRSSPLK